MASRGLALVLLLLLAVPAWGDGDEQTINTLPQADANFLPTLQNFLKQEPAERFEIQFTPYVESGGIHGAVAALIATPDPLIAFPGGFYTTESGAITYPDNATCWVIAHKDRTGNLSPFIRVPGTHYLIDCLTPTQPAAPTDTVYLMQVTTLAGAVTAVTDLRTRSPIDALPWSMPAYPVASLPIPSATGSLARATDQSRGVWMFQGDQWFSLGGETYNVKEFGAVCDGVTDDTAAIQSAIDAVGATGGIVLFPPGRCVITDELVVSTNGTVLVGSGRMGDLSRPAAEQGSYLLLGDTIAGSMVRFTNPAAASQGRGSGIAHLGFNGAGRVPTATAAIHVERNDHFWLQDVTIFDVQGRGVWTERCQSCRLVGLNIQNTGAAGQSAIDLSEHGAGDATTETVVRDVRLIANRATSYLTISANSSRNTISGFYATSDSGTADTERTFLTASGGANTLSDLVLDENAGAVPRVNLAGCCNVVTNVLARGTAGGHIISVAGQNNVVSGMYATSAPGSPASFYSVSIGADAHYAALSNIQTVFLGSVAVTAGAVGTLGANLTTRASPVAVINDSGTYSRWTNVYSDGSTFAGAIIALLGDDAYITNSVIRNSGAAVVGIQLAGARDGAVLNGVMDIKGAGGVGIRADPGATGIVIDQNYIVDVNGHGIQVGTSSSAAVPFTSVSNNVISNFGQSAASTYYGIALLANADAVAGGRVSGNRIADGGTASAASIHVDANLGVGWYENISGVGNNIVNSTAPQLARLSDNYWTFGTRVLTVVASASDIVITADADSFFITGTTNIDTINVAETWRGRRIVLMFEDVLTVNDGGNLELAGNFVTTANDTLELIYTGLVWVELSRSAN